MNEITRQFLKGTIVSAIYGFNEAGPQANLDSRVTQERIADAVVAKLNELFEIKAKQEFGFSEDKKIPVAHSLAREPRV